MRIFTWNENCTMAGRVVSSTEVERRTSGDGEVSDGDFTAWEGSEDEIRAEAEAAKNGSNSFMAKCGRAVLAELD